MPPRELCRRNTPHSNKYININDSKAHGSPKIRSGRRLRGRWRRIPFGPDRRSYFDGCSRRSPEIDTVSRLRTRQTARLFFERDSHASWGRGTIVPRLLSAATPSELLIFRRELRKSTCVRCATKKKRTRGCNLVLRCTRRGRSILGLAERSVPWIVPQRATREARPSRICPITLSPIALFIAP